MNVTETPTPAPTTVGESTPAIQESTTPVQSTETPTPVEGAAPVAEPVKETPPVEPPAEVKPVVPEKYELKTSEGSKLTSEQVKEVETYAREKGLSNEQAQELLTRQDSVVKSFHDQQVADHEAQVSQWVEAAKNDKEIGGTKFNEHVEYAHRALKHFDTNGDLSKGLELTGFGNHPEIIRVFAKIGKAMANDKFVHAPPGAPPAQKRPQDIMYDGNKARNKS